jgi:uncharacterized protein YigA (DUF484 family)
MNERAQTRDAGEAATEAVKAYVRVNRAKLAADGELLALLAPERPEIGSARDFQRFVIDRLLAENARLKAERDAAAGSQHAAARLSEGLRRFLLDLVDARSFAEAIAVTMALAPAFGADRMAICVEGEMGSAKSKAAGVRLVPPGTADSVLGPEAVSAILSSDGAQLLGAEGMHSVAAFRLKISRKAPAALLVLGAQASGAFEAEHIAGELAFVAAALERAVRAWLDLPRS